MEILIIIKLLAMTKNENETPDNLGRIIKNILSRVSEDTKKKVFRTKMDWAFAEKRERRRRRRRRRRGILCSILRPQAE